MVAVSSGVGGIDLVKANTFVPSPQFYFCLHQMESYVEKLVSFVIAVSLVGSGF